MHLFRTGYRSRDVISLYYGGEIIASNRINQAIEDALETDKERKFVETVEIAVNLQDVETVCDYVIIVNNGKLQMKESVKELMKKQNDFIQVRLGGDIDGFANILKNKKINLLSDGRTLRVPYLNEDTFQQIIDAAVESKCQLYEMERSKVTMDNVYLEVIE